MSGAIPSGVRVTYKGPNNSLVEKYYPTIMKIDVHEGVLYMRNSHGEQIVYALSEWVSFQQEREEVK